jgi:hypothetical protein
VSRPLVRMSATLAASLLAASVVAAEPTLDVGVGFAGRYRAGSWTPLVVSGARAGDELRVAAQDPDGRFVQSPPATVDGDVARFAVRVGRPAGRLRIDNATSGAATEIDLAPPLPSAGEVLLVLGDLPAIGRAARLLPRPGRTRPAVVGLGEGRGTAVRALDGRGRDLDGVDTVVACGRAVAACDSAVLSAVDAWVRDGGRLVLVAGTSAERVAAAGGIAATWLPGPVTECVPLRRLTAIESYARAAGLGERPGAAALRVPLLANRKAVTGVIEVFEGGTATDLPLVVRRARGLGTITWVGLDLDGEPFRGWPGTDTLLVRVLGGRPTDAEPAATAAAGTGPPDLAGQLRLALEAPGPDGGLAPVPFALIAGLGLLYVACIFPLDWWLVSRSGRPWVAWLTLPALTAGFTAAAWAVAGSWRQPAAADARTAEIVDVDAGGHTIRGRAWLAVWRRDNTAVDISLAAGDPGQGGETAVSWFADSGPGFGAIDAAVAHPTLAAADYGYGASLGVLRKVPVAAVSSRLFEAAWSGTTGGIVTADLVRDAQGTLRGGLAHHLPFALRDCRLAHGGWVYDVGDLAPDERHDLASGRGPRSLAGALARRESVKEREAAARWNRSGTDLGRILEVAGFHAAAGGPAYTGLESGRLAQLDLSPLLPLDRAVLVGTAADPSPGWTTPWRITDSSTSAAEAPPCAARLYRIVIPLAAPSAAAGAAGSAAE